MNKYYPDWLFDQTKIYHITAIDNLRGIIGSEAIYAINYKKIEHSSIASEEVQERRSKKEVPIAPWGVIHDYVPFYFAPRSPMLYVNHKKRIPNAKSQEDILYLVTYAQKIQTPYVFYDRHAVVEYAKVYSSFRGS